MVVTQLSERQTKHCDARRKRGVLVVLLRKTIDYFTLFNDENDAGGNNGIMVMTM